jgi:hypothetical protein
MRNTSHTLNIDTAIDNKVKSKKTRRSSTYGVIKENKINLAKAGSLIYNEQEIYIQELY